ncbi:MAG: HlyD family efflux transporter periplasmic adaptor subunit [Planctomycetota bacterium]
MNRCFVERSAIWLVFALAGSLIVADDTNDNEKNDSSETHVVRAGIIKIIDSVKVPAEISGVIAELEFREGQLVSQGQILGKLKSEELNVRLQKAEIEDQISRLTAANNIDIRFAKKSLEVSSRRVARSQNSNQRVPGAVPQSRIEEQELEKHRDELRVEQATRDQEISEMEVKLKATDLKLTELLVKKSSITSPIEGMIVGVERKAGEWVEPGDTILTVVRMNRLKVEGFVPVQIANQIESGTQATIRVQQSANKVLELKGKIIFINPVANPVNSSVPVWVEFDNSEVRLIPGLNAEIELNLSRR